MIKTVQQQQVQFILFTSSSRIQWIVFVLVLFSSTYNVLGQSKCFTIKDAISKKVIPYCNVVVDSTLGLVTNNNGQFCFDYSSENKAYFVSVSNIAYQSKSIEVCSNAMDTTIYLLSKVMDLREISVNWSNYKFTWFGVKTKEPDYYYNLWRFCHAGLVFEPHNKNNLVFEEVTIPIKNENEDKVPFRLHIFNIDSLGGVGEELLPDNVYGNIGVENKKEVSLNVLKYQIQVPKEGYIVTIELLSNNKPNELALGNRQYYERFNNEIGFVNARWRYRKLRRLVHGNPIVFI